MSVLGCVVLSASIAGAQVLFDRLGYHDGLANSSVSSIVQDEDGFLWFGTQAGLHRYDGYQMRVFTSEPFNPQSFSHQLVQTLYMDEGGILWVGTYGGLNRFDTRTGLVSHMRHSVDDPSSLSNDVVVSVGRDAAGTLWVGTLDGLNRLDSEADGTFTRFGPSSAGADDGSGALPNPVVRAVFRDSRADLWIGTYGGLTRVTSDADGRPRFETIRAGTDALPSPYVMSIAEDSTGSLWIGMWDGGVVRLDPDGTVRERYELPDNRVYQVLPVRSGLVYAATWGGGLSVIDPRSGGIQTSTHDPSDPFSLAHDIVYSLFEDSSGIVWIGTNGNGVSKLDPARVDFRFVHPDLPTERRLSTGRVQVLFEHRATGLLLVGVQGGGVNVRDPATGTVTVHRHDPSDGSGLGHDNVNALVDDGACVLIGTNAGIDRFCPGPGDFTAWEPAAVLPSPLIVYALLRGADDSLWIGTYDRGVYRFMSDGEIRHYPYDESNDRSLSNNLVYSIFADSRGTVWVTTNGGLNRYLPDENAFHRYLYDPADRSGISSNTAADMLEDSSGALWIATRSGGVARYHHETDTFTNIDTTDGLSSNLVASFLETEPGVLHVATTNGLNRVQIEPLVVTRVDERDGLTTREFARGALTTASGEHLFGGFSTIIRVPPTLSSGSGNVPQVQITAIDVMNRPFQTNLMPHLIDEITLPYTMDSIEFAFAALEYTLPQRNSYRYRLIGVDPEWVDAGNRRSARYTSLRPGRYVFEVLGSDSRGAWTDEPARIAVTLHPPFWRTPWFGAAVLGFLAASTALILRVRMNTLRLRAERLEAVVQERTESLLNVNAELEHANQAKARLFSIIAHDLRGPINGVAQLTGSVVRDFAAFDRDRLLEISSVISASARGLGAMLDNLLEWAQLELGSARLELAPVSVTAVIDSVLEAYSGAARAKELALTLDSPAGLDAGGRDAVVLADAHSLKTVLANLISNSVKFTRAGGAVTVAVIVHESSVAIVVRDSGVGIPEERVADLFQHVDAYRTNGTDGERGTGLGLTLCRDLVDRLSGSMKVESIQGAGTSVTVELPRAMSL